MQIERFAELSQPISLAIAEVAIISTRGQAGEIQLNGKMERLCREVGSPAGT